MRFAEKRCISVSQVLKDYTSKELDLWRAWGKREIIDNQRQENILAQGLAMYINANSKKGSPKSNPNDFIFKPCWLSDEMSDSETLINQFIKGFK